LGVGCSRQDIYALMHTCWFICNRSHRTEFKRAVGEDRGESACLL